jgi:hypothetical protein
MVEGERAMVTRKVVLTGGADGAGKEDDIDGDNLHDLGETSLGWL